MFDIVSSSGGKEGSLKLIPEFGNNALKASYKKFLKSNPDFPKKYNTTDRINLEKAIIKQLNERFKSDFVDIFKKYVDTQYVKYNFDPNSLKSDVKVIKGEDFNVYLATKNSVNHDGERIGFQLA